MPGRRRTTPEDRAKKIKTDQLRVRRRYKKDVTKDRRFVPGEREAVGMSVVVMRLAGYSNTQIGRAIGVSRGQVREILEQPEVADALLTLRQNLPQAALDLMEGYLIEAVQTLVDVMRTEQDNGIVLKAISELFDRAGLPKASRQERLNQSEESVHITADGEMMEMLRTAPPEIQEQAAQMIESLESLLRENAQKAEVDEPTAESDD